MVDALITVGAGVSGFTFEDSDGANWNEVEEAFKKGDIARAVDITLRFWTDGPSRTPEQVDGAVRERVRAMTTRNLHRSDDEDSPEPLSLEPPAIARLSEIRVPTLIVVGEEDVRDIVTI